MADFEAKLVECPYYIENTTSLQSKNNQIRCEGVDSSSTINLAFKTKQEQLAYMQKYCFSLRRCKDCKICKLLDEKYGVKHHE